MTSHTDNRKPIPELTLLAAGIVAAVIAGKAIGSSTWFAVFIFLCIFSGLAAVFSTVLSSRGLAFQVASTALGLAAVVFGLLWWNSHRHDNEIFSPVFIGYIGGGLLLSGILNLTYTLRHRHSENSTPS